MFRQTEVPGKDTPQPIDLPAGYAVGSSFPAFVSCHHAEMILADTTLFEPFLLLFVTPQPNPSK